NYLFATVLALVVFASVGMPSQTSSYEIDAVEEGWGAHGVLEPGDRIVKVEGQEYYARLDGVRSPSLISIMARSPGEPVALTVERRGQEVDVSITPQRDKAFFERSIFGLLPPERTP